MNQFIQHITPDTKGLSLDSSNGRYIVGNNLPFLNDSKTGGRTLCFWVNWSVIVSDLTNGTNLLQVRDAANTVDSLMNVGLFRLSGVTSNQNRMGISQRRNSGVDNNIVIGNTSIGAGIDYLMTFITTGTSYRLNLNGVEETIIAPSSPYYGVNDGSWFADQGYTMVNAAIMATSLGTVGSFNSIGKVYMAAYWDKALSTAELSELYNSGDVKDPTHLYTALSDLRCYYRMGEREYTEDSIATIYDSIIPSNLTTSGMTLSSIVPETISQNLSGYWRLKSDALDYSGNDRHGTAVGISYSSGSAVFSSVGTPDYVSVANNYAFSFTNGVNDTSYSVIFRASISAYKVGAEFGHWFVNKRGGSTNQEYQFIKGINVGLRDIQFSPTNINSLRNDTDSFTMALNQKYVICFTNDGSTTYGGMKIYVDGVLQSTTDGSTGSPSGVVDGNSNLVFGNAAWALTNKGTALDGTMSDIGIWKGRELNADEVLEFSN